MKKVVKAGKFPTGIADHDLIYTINIAKPRSETIIKIAIDRKKEDIIKFIKEVKEAPWHIYNIFDDIDDHYWMMVSIYRNTAEMI